VRLVLWTRHHPPALLPRESRRARQRGQSIVEFGLIAPLLLVLFMTLADFGRIFSTIVILEAAARNGAEAAANAYLSNPPATDALIASPPSPGDPAYYATIHRAAATVACTDARDLPNTDFGSGECRSMPLLRVCVHDGADPICAVSPYAGETSVPSECTEIANPPSNSQGGSQRRWVEVRICYQFTLIIPGPFNPFTNVWLQKTRMFAIPCYFATGTTDECG
jgi:hypothetical protein